MDWVLLIGVVWLAVAVLVGVLIGRGIRLADRKQKQAFAAEPPAPNFVVDGTPPGEAQAAETPVADAAPTPPTPDRARHAIPKSRQSGVRAPLSAAERAPSPRESGLL